jgi:Tfp pilus assembly protein PilV
MNTYLKNRKGGLSLIEVVIGAGIIGASLVAIVGLYGGLTRMSYDNTARIQAAMLAAEGIEIANLMRDNGWTSQIASLSNGTAYSFVWSNNTWRATTTPIVVDSKFYRTFVLSSVSRDASSNIVTSGGTNDTGTRKIGVSVAWSDGKATTTKVMESYIFNAYNN